MSHAAPNLDRLSMPSPSEIGDPLATLRRWRQPPRRRECCDLCGAPIGRDHPHLFEPDARRLSCACAACATLFSGRNGRFRRVPRRTRLLAEFRCDDAAWEALKMPIDLAFFSHRESAGDNGQPVVALYPSPAGATEAFPDPNAWRDLVAANPQLADLEPEVEALLVRRVGTSREGYLCPIDECFRLVGLVRANWRGLSGGSEVWNAIEGFFDDLRGRAES